MIKVPLLYRKDGLSFLSLISEFFKLTYIKKYCGVIQKPTLTLNVDKRI